MINLFWETKKVKVGDLKTLDFNPRKITEEKRQKLIKSLEKFNLAEIPAVNTDMVVIGGNQRVFALMLMGRADEEIDVRMPNRALTEAELKEYAIISNTHAGEWDALKLEEFFADIDLVDLGLDLDFEIQSEDMESAADELIEPKVQDDEFEMPVEIQTDIKKGDLIEIGPHRLLCGSATEDQSWETLLGDNLADLVVTDPPYNVDYTGGTKDALKIMNDKMHNSAFYQFLFDSFTAINKKIKAGGGWYIWHADSEGLNFRKAMIDAGILMKQTLIWVKNSIVLGRQDYQWKHEPCLYGWKPGAAHYFIDERFHSTVQEDKLDFKKMTKDQLLKLVEEIHSEKFETSVINQDKPLKNDIHPTMKPIELIGKLIRNSSKKGQKVVDGFLGSGSTMVASHQLKRICYGTELDPKYCQAIVDRMRKLDPNLEIKRNGEVWN